MGTVNKEKFTKERLIKRIADAEHKDIALVRSIYNSLEDTIVEALAYATPETDVSVKLFEGITLESSHVPEKVKKNNLTGKNITVAEHIKVKANITRNYQEKINS